MYKIVNFLGHFIDKKNRIKLVYSILITIFLSILELFSIGLVIPIIGLITNENFLANYKNLEVFFLFFSPLEYIKTDSYFFSINQKLISGAISLFLIIILIKFFVSVFLVSYNFKISKNINYFISKTVAKKNLYQNYEEYLKKDYTNYVITLLQEVTNVTFYVQEILRLISELIIISSIIFFLFIYKPFMCLIVLFVLGFSAFLYLKIIKSKNLVLGRQRRDNEDVRTNLLNQIFSGFSEIKLRNSENFFLEKYLSILNKTIIPDMKIQTYSSIPRFWFEVVAAISIVAIIHFLFFLNKTNSEIIINVSIFSFVSFRLIPSVNKLTSCYQYIKYFSPSAERVLKEIKENKNLNNIPINKKDILYKKLTLSKICYSYADKTIFKNLDLNLYDKKIYGLKGTSGSGKTTLCNLLLGLLKPSAGKIYMNDDLILDNKVIKNYISYVPQRIFVLNDTIKNNVAFGLSDKEIDENLVIQCLKKAELTDLLNDRGLNYKVSLDGVNLSVGQVQRLAIARCLYFKSKIIIFDEATSALDYSNEQKILSLIRKLNKTVLIISHNNEILKSCDEKFVLEDK
uniref:ATP-binding cassette domain-containing protein n=1 Tax=Candidatus Pelagibacter sp. TaxID=2024849 RepID=UPI003F8315BC